MRKFKIVLFIAIEMIELVLIIILCIKVMNPATLNYSDLIEKTVEIHIVDENGNEGFATGAKIKQGIITNKHVVYSSNHFYNTIEFRESDKKDYVPISVDKIIIDADSDLALLEFKTDDYLHLNYDFKIGDACFTIGNPNGNGLGVSFGNISTINYIDSVCIDSVIRLDMTLNKGNSGGPLMNKKGELIGLISFRLKDNNGDILNGIAYAITSSTIQRFLSSI